MPVSTRFHEKRVPLTPLDANRHAGAPASIKPSAAKAERVTDDLQVSGIFGGLASVVSEAAAGLASQGSVATHGPGTKPGQPS